MTSKSINNYTSHVIRDVFELVERNIIEPADRDS